MSELLSIVNSERKRGCSKRSNQQTGKTIASNDIPLKSIYERHKVNGAVKDLSNNYLQEELSKPEDFYLDLLRVFVKYGLMSGLVLRDALIRKDYYELSKTIKHKGEIREKLSDKYNTSVKNIEIIIYHSYKKKKIEENIMQMLLNGNG